MIGVILLLGAVMGSFVSSLRKDSLMGRSTCSQCNKNCSPMELIPLFSYLLQKGKCKRCKNPIPIYYPIFEGGGAILYLLLYIQTNSIVKVFIFGFLLLLVIYIGWLDLCEGYIYLVDVGIIFTIRIGLLYLIPSRVTTYFLSALIIGLFLGCLYLFTNAMGSGDIWYGSVLGLYFPFSLKTYYFIATAFILGGIVAAYKLFILHENKNQAMAFAPYLTISFIYFFYRSYL